MYVAVCEIELFIPAANSLKAKRQVVRSVVGRLKSRCNASVAEVGHQTVWQRATVAVAIVAGEQAHLESQVQMVRRVVEDVQGAEVASFGVDYQ